MNPAEPTTPRRRSRIPFLIAIILLLAAMIPRKVEVVPEWSVLVLNAEGEPAAGVDVEERCGFYGLSYDWKERLTTSAEGQVTFVPRSFNITSLEYVRQWIFAHLNVHGSFGSSGTVSIAPGSGWTRTEAEYGMDKKLYDAQGAQTVRRERRFETTLRFQRPFVPQQNWSNVKRIILNDPIAVTLRDRSGYTLLINLAREQCTGEVAELMQILVEKGADVNAEGKDGMTALHQACAHSDLAGITYLLSKGAQPNESIHDSAFSTTNGFTPLHFVTSGNSHKSIPVSLSSIPATDRIGAMTLLLEHGADINAKEAKGNTPLHLAAEWGDPKIVSALLDRGADARAVNAAGQTPRALIRLFVNANEVKALLSAAEAGHTK